jgi:hypothetical protein
MLWLTLQNCGESVNSVEGGVLGTNGFDEIVATTYTGHFFRGQCYYRIQSDG